MELPTLCNSQCTHNFWLFIVHRSQLVVLIYNTFFGTHRLHSAAHSRFAICTLFTVNCSLHDSQFAMLTSAFGRPESPESYMHRKKLLRIKTCRSKLLVHKLQIKINPFTPTVTSTWKRSVLQRLTMEVKWRHYKLLLVLIRDQTQLTQRIWFYFVRASRQATTLWSTSRSSLRTISWP